MTRSVDTCLPEPIRQSQILKLGHRNLLLLSATGMTAAAVVSTAAGAAATAATSTATVAAVPVVVKQEKVVPTATGTGTGTECNADAESSPDRVARLAAELVAATKPESTVGYPACAGWLTIRVVSAVSRRRATNARASGALGISVTRQR